MVGGEEACSPKRDGGRWREDLREAGRESQPPGGGRGRKEEENSKCSSSRGEGVFLSFFMNGTGSICRDNFTISLKCV